eukprot:TRINITY_DN59726_c0_g1_i1.p1 TRINITY_DN59726_c0_g1~~TRINITY_DN59726_c0_g1_i1.p1  ORF type:complete len:784 (+),score=89.28 TRINITY_DN59726_c0_g1_i1:35-2386(+)
MAGVVAILGLSDTSVTESASQQEHWEAEEDDEEDFDHAVMGHSFSTATVESEEHCKQEIEPVHLEVPEEDGGGTKTSATESEWEEVEQQEPESPSQGGGGLRGEADRILVGGEFPTLNINILLIGSRGDVQPFVALGKVLVQYGHRVRISTHTNFEKFVKEHGLDYYPLKGDPQSLMDFAVKHPDMVTLSPAEITKQSQHMKEIFFSVWDACTKNQDDDNPYRPDILISNPPVQVHVHVAQALQIPLRIFFTMPWTPTQAFPHPMHTYGLGTVYSNKNSYKVMEWMMWVGMKSLINELRSSKLGLPEVMNAATWLRSEHIPHVYCMSEAVVPTPEDWKDKQKNIHQCGFFFLETANNYEPPEDLAAFINDKSSGLPLAYVGFGSITGVDAKALTATVLDAVKVANIRAIVSAGWLGLEHTDTPDNVKFIGSCPHDWLFPQMDMVVHHGGAGTTANGLRFGKPTVIVHFFGDQPFWGEAVHKCGAGPESIPYKQLNVARLSQALVACSTPEIIKKAKEVGDTILHENGVHTACKIFHDTLPLDSQRRWLCTIAENEKWYPGAGWTSDKWTSLHGTYVLSKEAYETEVASNPNWKWADEWQTVISAKTDQQGWMYGQDMNKLKKIKWTTESTKWSNVRRRIWKRPKLHVSQVAPGVHEAIQSTGSAVAQIAPPASPPTALADDELIVKIYENERWFVGRGWGKHRFPTDRKRYTDKTGHVNKDPNGPPPAGYNWAGMWTVDKTTQECDQHGWRYAVDYPAHFHGGKPKWCDAVRRRVLYRIARKL